MVFKYKYANDVPALLSCINFHQFSLVLANALQNTDGWMDGWTHGQTKDRWMDQQTFFLFSFFLSTTRWIYERLFYIGNFIKYGQYRSIKVNHSQLRSIKVNEDISVSQSDCWSVTLIFFYPPQGGSIRSFFFLNFIKYGQLRSLRINWG